MRDIEEKGYANKVNRKQCRELELDLTCMYRVLSQLKYEELNDRAKWLLCVNNRVLPSEMETLMEKLNLKAQVGELKYDMTSSFQEPEWDLFKAINSVDPDDMIFPETFDFSQYDGEQLEDCRIDNIIERLKQKEETAVKYLKAEQEGEEK